MKKNHQNIFTSFLCLITAILGIISPVLASDYKVNKISEIKTVLKKIKPGDQIILASGEWKDAKIIFEANGTKENPIVLMSEEPGKVILTGASYLRIAGDYLIVDGLFFKDGAIDDGSVIDFRKDEKLESNNCRLTNCAIVDYNPLSKETEYKWVSLYGSHNRVDHCYFRNKVNEGCLLVVWLSNKPNYHLIDSNYFASRPPLGKNGAEIIRIGTSEWSMFPSYSTVENNYFEKCDGEREIISNKSLYNMYRHNTFVECKGTLTLRHGNFCTVDGNYFFGNNINGTGGIRIIGEGHKVINNYLADLEGIDVFAAISFMNGVPNSPANRYFQVKNAVVAFNTLINNKCSIEIGAGADEEVSLAPMNCTVANNIVFSTKDKLISESVTPQNFTWQKNIFYGADLGMIANDGIRLIDPKLYKGTDGLWQLSDSSPALKSAAGNFLFIKTDIEGNSRTVPTDIGCSQVSGHSFKYGPIKKDEVGPNWLDKIVNRIN